MTHYVECKQENNPTSIQQLLTKHWGTPLLIGDYLEVEAHLL